MFAFSVTYHVSIGFFLIQTFCLFWGPVSQLHPLPPSPSPTTCPMDPCSTSCTRAPVCTWIYIQSGHFFFFLQHQSMPEDCYCRWMTSSIQPFSSSPSALVVDQSQAVKFALDISSGMAFLHTLEPMVSRLYLNSKHIMVRPFALLSTNNNKKDI